MRNFVAKHDFNRASVHLDRSKEPQYTLEDGLDDYLVEMAENVAYEEYKARCDATLLPRGGSTGYSIESDHLITGSNEELTELLLSLTKESPTRKMD